MTAGEMIARLRVRIMDVDPSNAMFDDTALLLALGGALRTLQVRRVNFAALVAVVPNELDIQPEPSDELGELIVLRATADILQQRRVQMARTGEFGIIWKSGLEQEDSTTAAREFVKIIDAAEREYQEMLLIYGSKDGGVRAQ